MEALGRDINIVPAAKNAWLSLRNCKGWTFVLSGADTYTLSEAKDAAGTGSQNLPAIGASVPNANANGSTAWGARVGQAKAATLVVASGIAAVEVYADQLSDGYGYVKINAAGAGTVVAVANDLRVQREPNQLPAVSA